MFTTNLKHPAKSTDSDNKCNQSFDFQNRDTLILIQSIKIHSSDFMLANVDTHVRQSAILLARMGSGRHWHRRWTQTFFHSKTGVLMKSLLGKNTFITGGGSGIGLACAKSFVIDGANVLIMGRNQEKLDSALNELEELTEDNKVASYQGDVGNEEQIRMAVDTAAINGNLDIAVANAGTGGLGPIMATQSENWEQIMQTNLTGTFYTLKHAGIAMARSGGGAICAVSSIAGVRTHRFMGPYCVSKAGIDMLIRNSADELGIANIRVNSVCPGLVDTELATGLMTTEEVHNDYLNCMPIKRTGEVGDIAGAVRFLCGPDSSWITGVNLSVDGGHHLRRGPNVEPFSRMLFGDDLTEGRF
jgi:NAD(P)-dependent dehydrogenase (short-subunit alcohol dehydrogenase family)